MTIFRFDVRYSSERECESNDWKIILVYESKHAVCLHADVDIVDFRFFFPHIDSDRHPNEMIGQQEILCLLQSN